MAFYKLFYLLHRRTDWPDLLDLEKQFMMPEQYIAAKRQAEMALVKLMNHSSIKCGRKLIH